jgi:alkylated DNA repair dioxygenase AlkB
MNCPINPEIDLKPFRVKIAGDLNKILNTPDEQIDLDQYMKDTYIMVRDSVADTDLALDYAMLIPQIVQQMTAVDTVFAIALRKRGLTMDALLDHVDDMTEISTEKQLTELKEKLDKSEAEASGGPPVNVLGNISKGKEKKNEGEPKQLDLFGGPVTNEQLDAADKNQPQTPVTKPPLIQSIVRKFRKIIDIITSRKFVAPTALSSLIITKDPMYRQFLENIQRNIIKSLANQKDGENVRLFDDDGSDGQPGTPYPPVVLNMISVKELMNNELYKDVLSEAARADIKQYDAEMTGVYMVFTDLANNPVYFLENGKPTFDRSLGRPAYMQEKTSKWGTKTKFDVKAREASIKAMARYLNNDKVPYKNTPQGEKIWKRAEEIYQSELDQIQAARDFVNKKSGNKVHYTINGGSLGFLLLDQSGVETRTALSSLNENFNPEIADKAADKGEKEGFMYFTTEGMYGQPVAVERPTVEESGLGTMLADLIVEDLTDVNGQPLADSERQELIDQYLETHAEKLQVITNKKKPGEYLIILFGEILPHSTTEEKAQTKSKLLDFLVKRTYPIGKPLTYQEAQNKIAKNGKKIVKNREDGKFGDVLEITKEVKGVKIKEYKVLESTKLHPWKAGIISPLRSVSISGETGALKIKIEEIPYKDFVKSKFYIGHKLTAGGKLQRKDPYVTYKLTDESAEKVYAKELKERENTVKKVSENQAKVEESHEAPKSSDVQSLQDILDLGKKKGEGLNKSLDQKERGLKATMEQIVMAKEWYEAHPLRQHFEFEAMFDMINNGDGSGVARWTLAGITLFQGSDFSDLYHEAWHGFSQTFLTPKQRAEFYNETRKKSGSFKDHEGKLVTYRTATNIQIEEYLAERFRGYMLNPKTRNVTAKERSLFKRILDALRALFNDKSIKDMVTDSSSDAIINEMFEKLRMGNISEYTFSTENMEFGTLSKGARAYDATSSVAELNYDNSKKLVDMTDALISEYADMMNSQLSVTEMDERASLNAELATSNDSKRITDIKSRLAEIKAKSTYKFSSAAVKDKGFLEAAYTYSRFRFSAIHKELTKQYEESTNTVEKNIIFKRMQLLDWAIQNFGDPTNLENNKPGANSKGLIAYHITRSATFMDNSIVEKLDFEDMTEVEQYLGKQFDKSGNEVSMRELAKDEVVYLIKGIYKRDEKGDIIYNEFGIPEIEDFGKIWNRLARTLENTPNIEEAVIKLQAEAARFPQFSQLLSKLGPLQSDSLTSNSLWTSFHQAFGLARVPLVQVTLDKISSKEKTDIRYETRIGEAFNADYVVGKKWQADFSAVAPGSNPYILTDKEGNYLNIEKIKQDFNEGNINEKAWEFFNAMGFVLSDNAELKEVLADPNNRAAFAPIRFYDDLIKLHEKGKKLRYFGQITDSLSGRYKTLQKLEAKYSDHFSNFMVTNAEGNTQFEHTLNNSMTMVVNNINNSETYDDVINKPFLAHLNVDLNPFAEASAWMKSMFDLTGSRDKNAKDYNSNYGNRRKKANGQNVTLKLTNLSGVLLQNNGETLQDQGIASAKADEFTKLILDLHLAYNGTPELMRHADKGTSFSVSIDGPLYPNSGNTDSYVPASVFASDQKEARVFDRVLPHIIAEMKRMRISRNLLNSDITDTDFDYLEKGKEFATFKGVLSAKTKNILNKIVEANDVNIETAIDNSSDLRTQMFEDVTNYFVKSTAEVKKMYGEVGSFMSDTIVDDMIRKSNKGGVPLGKTAAKEAILESFVANSFIHNLESVGLLYGDLAQYNMKKEAFHKRNAGIGSTGKMFRTDGAMKTYLNSPEMQAPTFAAINAERLGLTSIREFNGTFNTAILEDNEVKSAYYNDMVKALGKEKAKKYGEELMNEADAQAFITFDSYRQLKIAEGAWGQEQEELFSAINRGDEIDPNDIITYFPVLKSQYWGPLKTDLKKNGLPITAFHKYSLFPIIPTVAKDKNLMKIHDRMVQEGIDYLTFRSGSKVGIVTKDASGLKPLYKEGTRDLAIPEEYNPEEPYFTKNVIFLEYLKDQLEINDHHKGQVIFSTQLRKLIEDGLMNNGVPIDFSTNEKGVKRMREWAKLSDEEKLEKSPYYKLLKNYESLVSKLTELAKTELLAEMEWTQDPVTKELSGDKANLLSFISRELDRKDLADHEIDFLGKGIDLSLSLNTEQIEKLLNSLIVKRLVKQKINGEALVQVSNTLMETIASTQNRNYKNPTAADNEKWGTDDLPGYRRDAATAPAPNERIKKTSVTGGHVNTIEDAFTDAESEYYVEEVEKLLDTEQNRESNRQDESKQVAVAYGPIEYKYSMGGGRTAIHTKKKMPNWMEELTRKAEIELGKPVGYFNHVLINRYGDGVGIGTHTDAESIYSNAKGEVGAVGIYSIGHTQNKHKIGGVSFDAKHNSLAEMSTGKLSHSVGKAKGTRYSINFRHIPNNKLEEADQVKPVENTTKAMKVKIAMQGDFLNLLELHHTDGKTIETIDRLNEVIKDEGWLEVGDNRKMITLTGVRIPVQGLNSMEFMEVYEFLPAEAGGIIVSPSEIVAKSGADFDVDKMTVFMPNISKRVVRAKLTNDFLRELAKENTDLDFSRDNINMILDAVKDKDSWKYLNEEDLAIYKILESKSTTEVVYNTGNSKKGLQNELIDTIATILALPTNFKALVTPNDIDLLDDIQKDMKQYIGGKNFLEEKNGEDNSEIISGTRVLEIPYNLYKHTSNNIGKQTLGLGAVDNTYNTVFNRIGAYMDPVGGNTSDADIRKIYNEPFNKRSEEDKKKLKEYRRQTLFLSHNTLETKDGTSISLSDLEDANNENSISDVINQLLNGWVDIAADAWIFNIQGNKEIAPTLLFMIQAGVPIKDAIHFLSNPIIRDYVKEQQLAKSTFADPLNKAPANPTYFRSKAAQQVFKNSKYGFGIRAENLKDNAVTSTAREEALKHVNKKFNIKQLYENIKEHAADPDNYMYSQEDRNAFLHFLEIENMSKAVRDIKMKMNVDTTTDQTLYEAQNRIKMKDGLRADSRFPTHLIDNIIKESPIGSFFVQPFQVELLGRLFPLRNHKTLNDFIDNVDDDLIKKTSGTKERFATDFKSDLISFLLQNELNDFDLTNILTYKGMLVNSTEEVASLNNGAYVKDGVMYINRSTLDEQYNMLMANTPISLANQYKKLGLSLVNKDMFPDKNQYFAFVLERERLRAAKSMAEVAKDPAFHDAEAIMGQEMKQTTDESLPNFKKRKKKAAYELYLKNKALEKSYNHYHMFKGPQSYAARFIQMKQKFPELASVYSLLDALSFTDSKGGFKNLKLNNTKLTGDEMNVLHENIEHLSSKGELKDAFPHLTEEELDYITGFFNELPMVAFLQSGLTTTSMFAMTRIIPQDQYLQIIQKSYAKIMKALDRGDTKLLEAYVTKFRSKNLWKDRSAKIRGKNYTTAGIITEEGSIEDQIFTVFNRLLFGNQNITGKYQSAENVYSPFKGGGIYDTKGSVDNMKNNPGNTYIYNGSIRNEGGTGSTLQNRADKEINDAALSNTIGLTTNNAYQPNQNIRETNNDIIKDINYKEGIAGLKTGSVKIDPKIKAQIDTDIAQLLELQAAGQVLMFSEEGYGQNLLEKDKNGKYFALGTFLYLSKQLFENFNYLNPEYLTSPSGQTIVQEAQQISDTEIKELNDEAVRDLMKNCLI